MKKQNLIIGLAAGAGVAAIAYKLLSRDIPKGANAVQHFEIDRYLGLWYEIARMPSRIEKNLNQLTEEYTREADGSIKVVTNAFNTQTREWTKATGKMKHARAKDVGMLKVSYFGPVYLAYNILDIDDDYQYALVSGSGLDFLWILSREHNIPNQVRNRFMKIAAHIGFDISKLEWM